MMFRHVKIILIGLLYISSCKEDVFIDTDLPSAEFNAEGKIFAYHQLNAITWPIVTLEIMPNSVSNNQYVEYYSKLIEAGFELDSFSINYQRGDLNHFTSSCQNLAVNARLTLPFPSNVTFSLVSGYRPYKVKISGTTNHYQQLNNTENWTLISVFTFDNTAKTISFEIDDLNACYVIAKHL